MSEIHDTKDSWTAVSWLVWGIGLWVLSIWVRLGYFPFVQITSDTLSPFVGAARWWNTGWFGAANPESDQWLWIVSTPILWAADSLSDLFWWKCIATTIVIPCACWMVTHFVDRHQWLWMAVVSSILTLDMGLVDTMLSSFRGYWAPECMAVATIGLILWQQGKLWGAHLTTVATIVAMGQHPLVLGTVPALIWLWYTQYQRAELWKWSIGLALVFSLPRVFWVYQLLQCDAGGLACLVDVAVSSSEDGSSLLSMIGLVLHDRLWIEMGFASVVMMFGWWHSENTELKYWVILSALGILLLGVSISTLRPYHFRVLIVPMFILSVEGLSRLRSSGISLGCLWIALVIIHRIEPVPWYSDVEQTDEAASVLCQQTEPVWLEGFGSKLTISPQSIGVSMVAQGCSVPISNRPTKTIWLIQRTQEVESLPDGEVMWVGETHQLRRVAWQDWTELSMRYKWSGHDVASLFISETDIHLQ